MSDRDALTPRLVTTLAEGYGANAFGRDLVAGLTVAIVALPLAMAIAIGSGTTPDRGLVTAIVAGFLISAFGGSNHQIGGPTAAFVVLVHHTIDDHGLSGLFLATAMAGVILMLAAVLRIGRHIEHVPHTVVVGFTAGIAATIVVGQFRDLLGIRTDLGADLIDRLAGVAIHAGEIRPATVAVSALAIGLMVLIARAAPRVPVYLLAVLVTAPLVAVLGLDADTIASRFGALPTALPAPALPEVSGAKVLAVLPSALAIAMLAGIESLLSCVIADRQTGEQHRPNAELMAQGIANVASACFGGLSATGALARTAANIRSGAVSPVSGMAHAVFLYLVLVWAAPAMGFIPLATLAAILLLVAIRIAEIDQIRHIMGDGPRGRQVEMLVTFFLTLLADLTIAIPAGIAVALIYRRLERRS